MHCTYSATKRNTSSCSCDGSWWPGQGQWSGSGPGRSGSGFCGLRRIQGRYGRPAPPERLNWPRLANALGSLRHTLALREARGERAGRGLCHLVSDRGWWPVRYAAPALLLLSVESSSAMNLTSHASGRKMLRATAAALCSRVLRCLLRLSAAESRGGMR